jgi:hypothetical protein
MPGCAALALFTIGLVESSVGLSEVFAYAADEADSITARVTFAELGTAARIASKLLALPAGLRVDSLLRLPSRSFARFARLSVEPII